jgi:hypothetical protein
MEADRIPEHLRRNSLNPIPEWTYPEGLIMTDTTYKVKASERYDGPDFEEYCISEGRYLPAVRDRSPCIPCPLHHLCQVGFEEQVRRIAVGENPSLTESCAFTDRTLSPENLL